MDEVEEAVKEEPGQAPEETATCAAGPPPCPVVAIGASAGGLEALQELFRHMPADTGFAFVVIQHLSPRHETLIASLLAPLTAMPVREVAADETVIEPDHVYVKPPSGTLTVDDCVLYVSKMPRLRGRRSPIDQFFRSLAEDQEDEAVCIVLSGTGTDGALGLKAIKEHGGLSLVQAPSTALYDSMPRGAMLTGAVDHVLPVAEMPARLVEHMARLRAGQGGNPERFREEIGGHLGRICSVLRRQTGHDFRHYKQTTLVRRVRRRMSEVGVDSVYAYLDRLNHDVSEVEQLFRDLLISVTHFFRDPDAFELLAAQVVPRLFEGKDADGSVRVWVPGCATGEEAYSLAMLLREHLDGLAAPPQVLVFATDIDSQALEAARQGLYPETVASQVAAGRLERFFVKQGNMYQVAREVREMCLFSLHNLIADPPFSRLDLVSCRNLLIYLESELQKKVAALFHYALRPGGFLFLGPSEMVAGQPELFRTLDKKHRLFQSRDTVVRPPFSFPLSERSRLGLRLPDETPRRPLPRQQEVARTFESVLLESFAPACVVVNESGDIVYFSPRTGRYLEPPAGTPVVNVVDMARKGLRLDVRTALHKAVTSRVQVVHESVAFELEGETGRVNVIVRPIPELGEDPGLYMVVFQEVVTAGEGTSEADPGEMAADDPLVRRLEAELRSTRDHLQATMEELESSNEELVSSNEELLSMNEELQSANEELQTSKEELQSVNEELETVNSELKKKLDELGRANSDLQNLFQSTRIATVFVDRELRIKKFTPAALEVFRLIDSDAGRPIADIAPRFAGVDLVADIREVLRTLSPRERQVRTEEEEAWYLLRILPYRTLDDVIDGVVLTFLDIGDAQASPVSRDTARPHRRIVPGRHHRQEPRRRDHELEHGGGEDVRLLGAGGGRPEHGPDRAAGAAGRAAAGLREAQAGTPGGELRDRAGAQRRPAARHLPDPLPDLRRCWPPRRRLGDRPRHLGPQGGRSGAGRSRPAQGRVPGPARPRAAQPPRPYPQLHPAPQVRRLRRGEAGEGSGDGGAAGDPSHPPGGRPAGRGPHLPRPDPPARGAARPRRGGAHGRGGPACGDHHRRPGAGARAARRSRVDHG